MRRSVRHRDQKGRFLIQTQAAANEQAGLPAADPVQCGAGAGGQTKAAFVEVLAGKAVDAEQRTLVQLKGLAVFIRNPRVEIGIGGHGQLADRLQNQVGAVGEAADERIADVESGGGATARDRRAVDAEHRRQVRYRIDVGAHVDERLPPQPGGRGDNPSPLCLGGEASAVDAGQTEGGACRNLLGPQDGTADVGVAEQGHGRAVQAQPTAEDGPGRFPAGIDQRGDQRKTVVVFEDVQAGGVLVGRGDPQTLEREGRDRQIGVGCLTFGVQLADQTALVAVVEAVVLVGGDHVIAVEQGLVGGPFGREAPAPRSVQVEPSMGQKIASMFFGQGNVGIVDAVAVDVEITEILRIGVAASGHHSAVGKPAAPLEVQQRRDPGVDLWADQPVLGR